MSVRCSTSDPRGEGEKERVEEEGQRGEGSDSSW